jgi:hypothetical protein
MTKRRKGRIGRDTNYVYWKEGRMWLGYLAEHPDYMTQGRSWAEPQENLKGICVPRAAP